MPLRGRREYYQHQVSGAIRVASKDAIRCGALWAMRVRARVRKIVRLGGCEMKILGCFPWDRNRVIVAFNRGERPTSG